MSQSTSWAACRSSIPDKVARPRTPREEMTAPTFSLPTQWRVFQYNFEKTLSEDQEQFFRFCAAIAPEPERTDEEWRDYISRLPSTETCSVSPLMLRLSIEVLRTGPHLPSDPRLLRRSANDNLAELRKLLGATKETDCNELGLEDRIVNALSIGFTKEVYKSLPSALINVLPFGTVSSALSMIDEMEPYMRKPDHKIGVLLWQCAVSQEASNSLHDWMASDEGKVHYFRVKDSLRQPLTQEELELSLTTLRCYELVLAPDYWWRNVGPSVPANQYVRDSRRGKVKETPWIAEFTRHLNGLLPKPPPSLWRVAVSSFKHACNNAPLHWLDTVLEDGPSSDVLVQTYWICRMQSVRLARLKKVSCNAPGGEAMERQASQRGY